MLALTKMSTHGEPDVKSDEKFDIYSSIDCSGMLAG
jgi:hypothetical protein